MKYRPTLIILLPSIQAYIEYCPLYDNVSVLLHFIYTNMQKILYVKVHPQITSAYVLKELWIVLKFIVINSFRVNKRKTS